MWKAQQDCRSFRNTGIFTGENPDPQGNQNQWAIYADGYRIMTVEEAYGKRTQAVVDAQARLVAAAGNAATQVEQLGYDGQAAIETLPELLDALKLLVEMENDPIRFVGCRGARLDLAYTAIAKAKEQL